MNDLSPGVTNRRAPPRDHLSAQAEGQCDPTVRQIERNLLSAPRKRGERLASGVIRGGAGSGEVGGVSLPRRLLFRRPEGAVGDNAGGEDGIFIHGFANMRRFQKMNGPSQIPSRLILCLGNPLVSDDGVGVRVSAFLRRRYPALLDSVDIIDGGNAGFDLLAVMSGREHIVLVDAVEAEGEPGDIIKVRPEELEKQTGYRVSLHGISVRDVCGALALLGEQPMVDIVGIVAGDVRTVADGLSPRVFDAVSRAAAEVVDLVYSWNGPRRPTRPAGERV